MESDSNGNLSMEYIQTNVWMDKQITKSTLWDDPRSNSKPYDWVSLKIYLLMCFKIFYNIPGSNSGLWKRNFRIKSREDPLSVKSTNKY